MNETFPDVNTESAGSLIPETSVSPAEPAEDGSLDVFPEVTSLPKEEKAETPEPAESRPEMDGLEVKEFEAEVVEEASAESVPVKEKKKTPSNQPAEKPESVSAEIPEDGLDIPEDGIEAPESVKTPGETAGETAGEDLLDPELLPVDSLDEVLPAVPENDGEKNPTLEDEFQDDMIDLENSLKEAPEPDALPDTLPAETERPGPAEKPAGTGSSEEETMIEMPELQLPLSGQKQSIKPFRVTMISAVEPAPVLQEVPETPVAVSPETKEAELRLQALDAPEKRPSFAQPADEYVIDSKVGAQKVKVNGQDKSRVGNTELNGNWEMDFQDQRGTFIYFDDGTGRATVQTPDPVYIYAPRFRAVRQVIDLNVDEQVMSTGDLFTPTSTQIQGRNVGTNTTLQQVQTGTQAGRDVMIQTKGSDGTSEMDGQVGAQAYNQEAVIAQENRTMVGPVAAEGKTSANTVGGLDMASTWTMNDQLQVFIDKQSASASVMNLAAPSLYTVKEGENKHSVRIYKVASKTSAKPGETVDFVIYFENTGSAPVGNISLVDNLPTRLEIVEDSAESSVDASFTYEVNGAGSQTLRWEVTQPLYPNEKGAVKFRALVR